MKNDSSGVVLRGITEKSIEAKSRLLCYHLYYHAAAIKQCSSVGRLLRGVSVGGLLRVVRGHEWVAALISLSGYAHSS